MPRVVSLLPSATEWVCALGLADDLVGITFECDHPDGVREGRAVVVAGPGHEHPDGTPFTPSEIDAAVREATEAGRPLSVLDDARLRALRPEVVLTQDLCGVCALPADAVRDAVERVGTPAHVVTLDPRTLDAVLDGASAVAAACGVPAAGAELLAGLRGRLRTIADAVAGRPAPRVLVLEWTDPPFVAGHWVPDLVRAAGGVPVLCSPGGRSTTTTWQEVAGALRSGARRASREERADVVLVAPCGYGLDDAVRQARDVLGHLPDGVEVWAVDAGAVVTRPGPRVVDGVEALAQAWHEGAGVRRPDLVAPVRAAGSGA